MQVEITVAACLLACLVNPFWTELLAASTTAGLHLSSGPAVNNGLSDSKFHNFHI